MNFQQLNVNVETKGFLSMFFNDRRYKYVENAHVCCSGTVIVNRTVTDDAEMFTSEVHDPYARTTGA